MNILICNDDGIHAPGIAALVKAVRDFGKVEVVAPAAEQSAVGHAITIASPLKASKIHKEGAFFGYAVNGTPADCVKLGVTKILDRRPDLVLSGINHGPNSGISVLYSGTVSGATEGGILGIPSIAFSMATFQQPLWETGIEIVKRVMKRVVQQPLPADSLLNVNIPSLPLDQLKGIAVTRMGKSRYIEEFDERVDPRGNTYYWMDGVLKLFDDAGENDVTLLQDGYVTITPIKFDLTHYEVMESVRAWSEGL